MSDRIKVKVDFSSGLFEFEGAHRLLKPTLEVFKANSNIKFDLATPEKKAKPRAPLKNKATNPEIKREARKPDAKIPKKQVSGYKPKYNPDLDLLKLTKFLDDKVLKKNTEYVLAFVVFLKEELKIENISGNEIYTCFLELKGVLKIPESFRDTLRNAQNRAHVIKYDKGFTNIVLTTKGTNVFFHDILKRHEGTK